VLCDNEATGPRSRPALQAPIAAQPSGFATLIRLGLIAQIGVPIWQTLGPWISPARPRFGEAIASGLAEGFKPCRECSPSICRTLNSKRSADARRLPVAYLVNHTAE